MRVYRVSVFIPATLFGVSLVDIVFGIGGSPHEARSARASGDTEHDSDLRAPEPRKSAKVEP